MGEIVNLRRVRKSKARAEKELHAAENRAKSSKSKAVRDAEAKIRDKALRDLEGNRREDD